MSQNERPITTSEVKLLSPECLEVPRVQFKEQKMKIVREHEERPLPLNLHHSSQSFFFPQLYLGVLTVI